MNCALSLTKPMSSRLLLIVFGFTALFPTLSFAADDCTCRFKGQDVPVGNVVCLELPAGNMMAMCGRVLNNTSWKFLEKECPVGKIEKPALFTPVRIG